MCVVNVQLEELIDQNMYYCGVCGALREGMRQAVLRRAPRVLNLHLLRFVYERETMRKKKISSALHVPATLDATHYFSANQHLHGSLSDPNGHQSIVPVPSLSPFLLPLSALDPNPSPHALISSPRRSHTLSTASTLCTLYCTLHVL